MKLRPTILFILLAAWMMPALSMADEVLIIANENVAVSSLGKDDIRQIFLGQKTTWDDGTKIIFVVQDRTQAGDAFLKTYLQKTAIQYDRFWKIQVFTGKGRAPLSFSSNQELADFVSRTRGAIGYVSATTNVEHVKIIAVQ